MYCKIDTPTSTYLYFKYTKTCTQISKLQQYNISNTKEKKDNEKNNGKKRTTMTMTNKKNEIANDNKKEKEEIEEGLNVIGQHPDVHY